MSDSANAMQSQIAANHSMQMMGGESGRGAGGSNMGTNLPAVMGNPPDSISKLVDSLGKGPLTLTVQDLGGAISKFVGKDNEQGMFPPVNTLQGIEPPHGIAKQVPGGISIGAKG